MKLSSSCSIILFLLLLALFSAHHSLQQQLGPDAVHLSKIEVLTFRKGQYTSARRTRAFPQLNCKYTPDGYIPSVIQCKNKGYDGTSYQWKCEAEMDEKYRFGSDLDVNCEGYRYAGDEFVLRGSCALSFSIELTGKGTREDQQRKRTNRYQQNQQHYHHETTKPANPSSLGGFGVVLIVLVLVAVIWLTKSSRRSTPVGANSSAASYSSSTNSTPYPQGTSSIYPGVNPTYTTDENYNPNYYPDSSNTGSSTTSFGTVPTFVAGAAAGYALNSMLNRQTPNTTRGNNGSYFNTSDSTYNATNDEDYHHHHDTDNTHSTTTRTTKGYAGTTSR
ncbi:hypothetical protein C9374_013357 [Naegleria lovaniensis]|uniref:Store-operated calcium entry-associated regulatory factor n=1 Tax=Naegleria lovaniensis TaxID=51637 RepID=A0AA88H209_NAELO|nr:uncharacterized protein C9374_013357 [Naegleria lovaniensis]KAG2391872.1 hypothetical protein C9374_013357 [Naegleria lovaniensis]